MKRALLIIAAILTILTISQAQIQVATNNNVGIGVNNAVSKLAVGNVGTTDGYVYIENQKVTGSPYAFRTVQDAPNTSSNAYGSQTVINIASTGAKQFGFLSQAYAGASLSAGRTYGLYTAAGNATSGYNYGVYSFLVQQSGYTNYGAAIFAAIPSKASDVPVPGYYAGYFRGQVFIEDSLHVNLEVSSPHFIVWSDERLKRNITPLSTGNMNRLKQLTAVTYNLISVEDYRLSKLTIVNDTGHIAASNSNLNSKVDTTTSNIGFIAQDLMKVFPQLVHSDKDGILGVDYTGLIPVLVEALKEQQVTIEGLKSDIILLKQKLNIATPPVTPTNPTLVQ
jgi:Chaperone of endosialidase